jgi:hypothetical protein
MRSNLKSWLLVCMAIVLLIAVNRVDLLLIVAPLALLVAWFFRGMERNTPA